MLQVTPIVFVADDGVCVRESLELLARCEGWQPETFASAQEFLDHPRAPVPSCLILHISLPGYIAVARDEDDWHIRTATSLWRSRPVIPTQTTGYGVGVSGPLNIQVGGELGISGITEKAHRGKAMQTMKAHSLADLVKMGARLRPAPANEGGVKFTRHDH